MTDPLRDFFEKISRDGRIGPSHISLYIALYLRSGGAEPFVINRASLMPAAKIRSRHTYHLRMRELHAYGYIHYEASKDARTGSRVRLIGKKAIS